MTKKFMHEKATIYNSDILNKNLFKEKFADVIITSPPYNLDIPYNSNDDKLSHESYLGFTKKWLTNCYNWSKSSARLLLNIPLDKNKNGQQSVGADITTIAKEVGWSYMSTIVWNEQNISRRTAWGSWLSASAPYVIAPVELILVMFKDTWKKIGDGRTGKEQSTISAEEFKTWTNGVWTFNGESKKRIGHPAPFPRELPKRCIKLFSFIGDTIFDPFCGSGTTLIEANLLDRNCIGVDIDENYCNLALERLKHISQQKKLF